MSDPENKTPLVIIDRVLTGRFANALNRFLSHIKSAQDLIGAEVRVGTSIKDAQTICSETGQAVVLYRVGPWIDQKVRVDRHSFEPRSSIFIPSAIMVDGRQQEFHRSHIVSHNSDGTSNIERVDGMVGNLQMAEAEHGVTIPALLHRPSGTQGMKRAIQVEYTSNFDLLTLDEPSKPSRPSRKDNN